MGMSASRLDSQDQRVRQALGVVSQLKDDAKYSGLLARIVFLTQGEAASPAMIERLCAPDPVLAPAIHRTFEYALAELGIGEYYGLAKAMESLGPDRTARYLTGAAIGSLVQVAAPVSGISAISCLRQSLAMGCISYALAKSSKDIRSIDAYRAGVLCHLGVPILGICFGEKYGGVYHMIAGTSEPLYSVEREHFGISHPEIGALFGAKIGLVDRTCQAIREHHEPLKAIRGVSQVLALAELLAHDLGYDGGTANASQGYERSWTVRLGLQDAQIPRLIEEISFESALFSHIFATN